MVWSLLILPAVLGLALLIRGWRGRRIDNHPLCRRCGYDLVASLQDPKCPECGVDLARSRAIRIGHRRKRKPSLIVGTMLLVATLGFGGALGWAVFRGIDFNPYKPLWLLRYEAARVKPQAAINAQREILMRLTNGKLAKGEIDNIVAEALRVQCDGSATWFIWMGDFIERAWLQHDVGDDIAIQYMRNAIEPALSLDIPDRVRQGGMLRVQFSHRPVRSGQAGTFMYELAHESVKLDNGYMLAQFGGLSRSMLTARSYGSSSTAAPVQLQLGRQRVSAPVTVRVGPTTSAALLERDGDASESWVMATWSMTAEEHFEVVAPDAEVVETVHDPALEGEIRKAVTIESCRATDMRGMGATLVCQVAMADLPIDVAFEIFVRIGEREWPAGTTVKEQRAPSSGMMLVVGLGASEHLSRDFPADVNKVDIVLRSSKSIAEAGGLSRIWEGEIVIKDVPLERPQGR